MSRSLFKTVGEVISGDEENRIMAFLGDLYRRKGVMNFVVVALVDVNEQLVIRCYSEVTKRSSFIVSSYTTYQSESEKEILEVFTNNNCVFQNERMTFGVFVRGKNSTPRVHQVQSPYNVQITLYNVQHSQIRHLPKHSLCWMGSSMAGLLKCQFIKSCVLGQKD